MADPNDFQPGDTDVILSRKTLGRLKEVVEASAAAAALLAGGAVVNIAGGAISIKDAVSLEDVRAIGIDPAGTEVGLVVRNIPSGTQITSASVPLVAAAPLWPRSVMYL